MRVLIGLLRDLKRGWRYRHCRHVFWLEDIFGDVVTVRCERCGMTRSGTLWCDTPYTPIKTEYP